MPAPFAGPVVSLEYLESFLLPPWIFELFLLIFGFPYGSSFTHICLTPFSFTSSPNCGNQFREHLIQKKRPARVADGGEP